MAVKIYILKLFIYFSHYTKNIRGCLRSYFLYNLVFDSAPAQAEGLPVVASTTICANVIMRFIRALPPFSRVLKARKPSLRLASQPPRSLANPGGNQTQSPPYLGDLGGVKVIFFTFKTPSNRRSLFITFRSNKRYCTSYNNKRLENKYCDRNTKRRSPTAIDKYQLTFVKYHCDRCSFLA